MRQDKANNFQDNFLNALRKKKLPVTVYLINGVKLQGIVGSFDSFCITLRRGPQIQMIYKHAVATVVPAGALTPEDFGIEVGEHDDVPMPDDFE
ncbi:RNA chaperone Hfq [bacterium]|nr:RNA chaperone Hfq [bacterium]